MTRKKRTKVSTVDTTPKLPSSASPNHEGGVSGVSTSTAPEDTKKQELTFELIEQLLEKKLSTVSSQLILDITKKIPNHESQLNKIELSVNNTYSKLDGVINSYKENALLKQENEKLKKDIQQAKERISDLEPKLKKLTEAESKIKTLESSISRLNSTLQQTQQEVKAKTQTIQELETFKTQAMEKESEYQQKIAQLEMELVSMKNKESFAVTDQQTEITISELQKSYQKIKDDAFNFMLTYAPEADDDTGDWVMATLEKSLFLNCVFGASDRRQVLLNEASLRARKMFLDAAQQRAAVSVDTLLQEDAVRKMNEMMQLCFRVGEICETSTIPKFSFDWSVDSGKECVIPNVIAGKGQKIVEGVVIDKLMSSQQ